MKKLSYEFLDPFMEKEFIKEDINKDQVLNDFCAIPWYKLVINHFLGNKDSDSGLEKNIPRNDFWYFNISCLDSQDEKSQLLIVPNFASRESFSENDLRFSIEYRRPKMLETPKWKRLFGGADKEFNSNFCTSIHEISIVDTKALLVYFLNKEFQFLESKITETAPLMSNRFN